MVTCLDLLPSQRCSTFVFMFLPGEYHALLTHVDHVLLSQVLKKIVEIPFKFENKYEIRTECSTVFYTEIKYDTIVK